MQTTILRKATIASCALAAAAFMCGASLAVADDVRTSSELLEAEHLASAILALDGDSAYGEYLGGECVTCHQQSGGSDGIPPIVGLPVDYTVKALVEYKLGIRPNDVMQLMSKRLANEEIAALAAYFAEIKAD